MSKQTLHGKIHRGDWERVLPGVVGVAGVPIYSERRLFAAVLYGGAGSAVSGTTAASVWGITGFRAEPIVVSTTKWKCTRPPTFSDGTRIRIRRVDEYLLETTCEVDALPATTVPRTLLDLAGELHPRVESALDESLRNGLTSLQEMSLFYERSWLRGRRGIAVLRNLLTERLGTSRSESDAEELLARLIRARALPACVQQLPVALPSGDIRIDFAYPDIPLAIECDSYAWHMNRDAFARDRRRDAELQALGWRVLRFTWHQLRFEPDYVVEQILIQLIRADATVPSRP